MTDSHGEPRTGPGGRREKKRLPFGLFYFRGTKTPMRPKPRLTTLFMLRMQRHERERLQRVADELGMNAAQLARLALREGVTRIRGKFPASEHVEGEQS